MKVRVYQYPRNKWHLNPETGLWYSQPRTKEETLQNKQAISNMTFVPVRDISWDSNRNQMTVVMP